MTKKRKIALLTSVHVWNDTRIFVREAHALAAAGFHTELIAEKEADEVIDGIHCTALPKSRNRIERMLISPIRILLKARRSQVCHFHDPELIPIALVLKLLGKKIVYDVHEDVPRQILVKHWIHPALRRITSRIMGIIEAFAARCFDRIVVATPTIAARFPSDKTFVVRNYPLLDELASNISNYDSREANIVYVGVISIARGAREMVNAFAKLNRDTARLHLAGNISPEHLQPELAIHPNITLHGLVERSKALQLLDTARIGLVVLLPSQNYLDSLPTKMFEYMYAGIPVIASDFPLWRGILEESNAGLLVDPTNIQEIADAIAWLLDNPNEAKDMGQRGRQAVQEKYRWSEEARTLTDMYRELLAESSR